MVSGITKLFSSDALAGRGLDHDLVWSDHINSSAEHAGRITE